MFTARFINFRALIFLLLFVIIIPRVPLSQGQIQTLTDVYRRLKTRSPANYDLCFLNSVEKCPRDFISDIDHCLGSLEKSQDEEAFHLCICRLRREKKPSWNACSNCLRTEYKEEVLEIWDEDCSFFTPVTLSGGWLCECQKPK